MKKSLSEHISESLSTLNEASIKNFSDKNAATSFDLSAARSNFFALYSDGDVINVSRDIDKGLHRINAWTSLDDMYKIYGAKDNNFRHLLAFYYKKSYALAARKKYNIDNDESTVTENLIVVSSSTSLSDSTKINADDIMSAQIMQDKKTVELSLYPDAKEKRYVSVNYAKAHNILETVEQVAEAKQIRTANLNISVTEDNYGIIVQELGNMKESVFISWSDLDNINKLRKK